MKASTVRQFEICYKQALVENTLRSCKRLNCCTVCYVLLREDIVFNNVHISMSKLGTSRPALQHPRPYRRYRGWAERSRCQENVPTSTFCLDQLQRTSRHGRAADTGDPVGAADCVVVICVDAGLSVSPCACVSLKLST